LGSQKSSRLTVWQYRQEFFEAAQRKLPAIGRYLWRYGMQANGEKTRTEVIQAWQNHFHLRYAWAFECAWMTLLVWDRHPEHRHRLMWSAAPRAHNLAEGGLFTFNFAIERQFHHGLDFGLFKLSIHGALEAELERFGKSAGTQNLGNRRRPRDLQRAYECLALRLCKGLSPVQINSRPEYHRDWTTLAKDIKSAAELAGIQPARRGRPAKNIAR
jgi:hypothetical protein